jgi:hypothetical protein
LRPNTIQPDEFFTLSDGDLSKMSDTELISFADSYLGLIIPLGTERSKVLTRIVNASSAIRDGS